MRDDGNDGRRARVQNFLSASPLCYEHIEIRSCDATQAAVVKCAIHCAVPSTPNGVGNQSSSAVRIYCSLRSHMEDVTRKRLAK